MAGKGLRRFMNEDEFLDKIYEYMKYCKKHDNMANISGFCAWSRTPRTTFYENKNYYPKAWELMNDILEDNTINNKGVEASMRIFYLKNKFGYKDKIETENTNLNTNKNIDMSALTDEQIDKILKSE